MTSNFLLAGQFSQGVDPDAPTQVPVELDDEEDGEVEERQSVAASDDDEPQNRHSRSRSGSRAGSRNSGSRKGSPGAGSRSPSGQRSRSGSPGRSRSGSPAKSRSRYYMAGFFRNLQKNSTYIHTTYGHTACKTWFYLLRTHLPT